MDGLVFYWFCWIFWVITTFFMERKKQRLFLSRWILLAILFSNMYITIGDLDISITFLIVLVGSFILVPQNNSNLLLLLFSAFTIMVGYTSFLIWEKHAPIWLFMPRDLLLPLATVMLISFVGKGFYNRLIIGLIGLCSGEFLYSFMLVSYRIHESTGEKAFLDILLTVIFILACLALWKKLQQKLIILIENYKQLLRWQNE